MHKKTDTQWFHQTPPVYPFLFLLPPYIQNFTLSKTTNTPAFSISYRTEKAAAY